MQVINRQERAKGVAALWHARYFNKQINQWRFQSPVGGDKEDIYNALVALGPWPTADQVDEAIGNSSWTRLCCDECRATVETVVEVGELSDYESATALMCIPCLQRALHMGMTHNAA